MNNLPIEIEDYIIDYIYSNTCYLSNADFQSIKKCACISKKFNREFKCKPLYFKINNTHIEFCKTHDKLIFNNLFKIMDKVTYNFYNDFNFYVNIENENGIKLDVPLSVFNLEPYISIMDDDYFFYYLDLSAYLINDNIKRLKNYIKQLFLISNIDYSDNINGYNSFKIKDNKVINYNINQLKKFYFTHFLNNKNTI